MSSLARLSPDLPCPSPLCVLPVLGSTLLDDSAEFHSVSAISKPINAKDDVSIMWETGSCYNILQHKSHITELTPYSSGAMLARPEYGLTHPEAM